MYILMILVSFSSGECVDVNNLRICEFTLVIVIHFMNGSGVCSVISITDFNVQIYLNHR